MSAHMRWLGRSEAVSFMQRYEHLGNVGLGVWHLGMVLDDDVVSVLSFGVPCFATNRGVLGLLAAERNLKLVQLCRGGTRSHAPHNAASRAIALGLRSIRERCGDSLVVAYADPRFGELGTIYQACNAVHTGWTDPKGQAEYIVDGRRMNAWAVRKRYGTRSRNKLATLGLDVQVLLLPPKLRYVMVAAGPRLRRSVLRDLESLKVPYPKRDAEGVPSMKKILPLVTAP